MRQNNNDFDEYSAGLLKDRIYPKVVHYKLLILR